MNIKFGMDNFYVRYLKRFLNSEMFHTNRVLGKFEQSDLALLINYLNLPNVKDMFTVSNEIFSQFPDLNTYFNYQLKDNYIVFKSKKLTTEHSDYIKTNIKQIRTYCESVGWKVGDIADWIDISKDINGDGLINEEDRQILHNIVYNGTQYDEDIMDRADLNRDGYVNQDDISIFDNYINNTYLGFTIYKENRENYFPNKDMLVFINQFTGDFLYQYCIKQDDGNGSDDTPHKDPFQNHKVAIYKCKPGQKITIAHNSEADQPIIVGSSQAKLRQNITEFPLDNIVETTLKPGQYLQYTCASAKEGTGYDANYVCIQVASNYGNLTGSKVVDMALEVGDINFDGVIDIQDYHLLATYTATKSGEPVPDYLKWQPTEKQLAVMNCDPSSKDINTADAVRLKRFIDGDPSIPSLGVTHFEQEINTGYEDINNVENLLIIDGHYDKEVNIPFKEFTTNDWVIHEKFFNYLLGMSIHEYSNQDDISYLQKLLKEVYPQYIYNEDIFYPGYYSDNMKIILKDYQEKKINYVLGDLNKDGILSEADLILLRKYLEDAVDLNRINQYLADPYTYPLTPEEKIRLDRDHNGIVDKWDQQIIEKELYTKYPATFRTRADVNQDGYINEDDYTYLEREVNGITTNLKNYNISFMLGWCDVQTEDLLEADANFYGNISEVSK